MWEGGGEGAEGRGGEQPNRNKTSSERNTPTHQRFSQKHLEEAKRLLTDILAFKGTVRHFGEFTFSLRNAFRLLTVSH